MLRLEEVYVYVLLNLHCGSTLTRSGSRWPHSDVVRSSGHSEVVLSELTIRKIRDHTSPIHLQEEKTIMSGVSDGSGSGKK